jgi:hypothetical protein
MTNTITEPGPFDALSRARPDEPLFPLLGRDPAAPAAITEWCRVRRNTAIRTFAPGSEELVEELRQCADAEAVALQMQAYRTGWHEEEQERAERVAHSGVCGETPEQRERARLVADTVGHLREAAFHVNEAGERLAALGPDALAIYKASGMTGLPLLDLADVLGALREIDAAITPRRGAVPQAEAPEPVAPEPVAPSFGEIVRDLPSDLREKLFDGVEDEIENSLAQLRDGHLGCEHDWIKQSADGGGYSWLIDRCSKCGEERA